jgi:hypothetical protein
MTGLLKTTQSPSTVLEDLTSLGVGADWTVDTKMLKLLLSQEQGSETQPAASGDRVKRGV